MHQWHHELLAYILDQYKASLFLEVRINKENMQIPWWTERQNSFFITIVTFQLHLKTNMFHNLI